MNSIFTITTFSRPREDGRHPHEKRTWGWFPTYQEAYDAIGVMVTPNEDADAPGVALDIIIESNTLPYILIEEVGVGCPRPLTGFTDERGQEGTWWFLATEVAPRSCTYTVQPCPTPDWAKIVCHFSMG